MVVSVLSAAGVVTTQKAAAADPAPYVIDVYAPAGTIYSWTGKDVNFRYETVTQDIQLGRVLTSKARGNAASAMLISPPRLAYGRAIAGVGVALQPNVDIRSEEWALVKDRPVIVKVTTQTSIGMIGDSLVHAVAYVNTAGTFTVSPDLRITGALICSKFGSPAPNVIKISTYSRTQTTTIAEYSPGTPLTLENVYTGIQAGVTVETSINPHPVSEIASARISVTSFELRFLPSEVGPLPS